MKLDQFILQECVVFQMCAVPKGFVIRVLLTGLNYSV